MYNMYIFMIYVTIGLILALIMAIKDRNTIDDRIIRLLKAFKLDENPSDKDVSCIKFFCVFVSIFIWPIAYINDGGRIYRLYTKFKNRKKK